MAHRNISFRTVGEGPILILLHGYAGSVLHWDSVVKNLKDHFQLVIPSLNHVFMNKKSFTFSEQVDVFAKFLQTHFPNQKVHLAGASYGGALVWGVTSRYPELVGKSIFINPMPPAPVEKFSIPALYAILRLPLSLPVIYLILRTPLGRFFLTKALEVFQVEELERWGQQRLRGKKLYFIGRVIHNFSFILKNENWKQWENHLKKWTHMSLLIFDQRDPLFKPQTYHQFQELLACHLTQELSSAGHIAIHSQGLEISEMIQDFINGEQTVAEVS